MSARDRRIGSSRRDERGVATVLAIGLMGVLLGVTVIAAGATRVAVAGHRAAAAADLAALAGAQAVRDGADGCAAAERSALRNQGRVTTCTQEGLEVQVTVEVQTPRMVGLVWSLPATARAGPDGVG